MRKAKSTPLLWPKVLCTDLEINIFIPTSIVNVPVLLVYNFCVQNNTVTVVKEK